MKKLDRDGYDHMTSGAEVMSRDRYGDKVLRLADGSMAKFFRLKRVFSSGVIWPYAKRFERAARKLLEMNVPCVEVIASYRVRFIGRDVVIYKPLEGETLRTALIRSSGQTVLLETFSGFLAHLHNKGIYFRAVHFGNVIVLPDKRFGLIDVSEFHLCRAPLSISKRVRNFKPMFRYKEDREAILNFGFERFLDGYIRESRLPPEARHPFIKWYKSRAPVDMQNT